jgi:hypothetical protein
MKVLKGNTPPIQKCEFGDFELKPDDGWKIGQAYIDYESGLLVVNTRDENRANWENTGYGTRIIPTKEYIIDVKSGDILSPSTWTKYFSYEPKTIFSEDGKYKLITTRIHYPENSFDSIKEELIDVESGKVISSSDGVAFSKEKRVNLLEEKYKILEKQAIEEAKPTLKEIYETEYVKLKNEDVILYYFSDTSIFRLIFRDHVFHLEQRYEKWRYNLDFANLKYESFRSYNSIDSFRNEFLKSKNWYVHHTPFKPSAKDPINPLLCWFVVDFFNQLRKVHDFAFAEYEKLNVWENFLFQKDSVRPGEYKQYCSNCKKPVEYYPIYPKHICDDCHEKTITDEHGVVISFSNLSVSGGMRITYMDGGKLLREETDLEVKLCFIDGKRFKATEAKFGGIVIQSEV